MTRNTVSPSVRDRFRISSSNAAAPIGSSPAVGSSRNTISGSRASARARPARLRMPPESSEGNLSPALHGRPEREILRRASASRVAGSSSSILPKGTSTFSRTVSEEKSAPSWNMTPTRLGEAGPFGLGRRLHVGAEHPDGARRRPLQPGDGAQEHRLAGARAADDTEDLAPPDVEVEVVVDDVGAELVAQAPDLDDGVAGHRPISW